MAEEVRPDLDAGEPVRVLERIEDLARHKIGGPSLRRTARSPRRGRIGLAEGRRGEFGRAQEQLDRADRLAAGAGAVAAQQAVARPRSSSKTGKRSPLPRLRRCTRRFRKGNGRRSFRRPRPCSASVPEHPAARQARSRAWQQIAAIGPPRQHDGRSGLPDGAATPGG